ncbi:MAG TPA: aspartate--tRNA ligase [Bacteroidales bacterium]|nr:MAG: Aspartate--tRNA ligase [Bacteroidetes bacterium ADurb.Bin217]HPH15609.1 aspartate--tRNA ligase [Bacteroidales bacterium]HPM12193.1 aspartate--tRNA ligase [Bacteroidales bacterium]
MYRTHTCGELRISDVGKSVTLSGWVQRTRKLGGMTFVDLRDRYGITQIVADGSQNAFMQEQLNELGREYVIQIQGIVIERESKNKHNPTGEIEITAHTITILNKAQLPPFTIEDDTDGGEEMRMKYRYLDIRRNPIRSNLELRHRMAQAIRKYLDTQGFLEIETPVLIGSTPEGARDFVVPSRVWPGQFYALPQSPQLFKQLLMVGGIDKYFQIVKCFRDEDLRADRQPEFTQIDCEMSFVEQQDIIAMFEGLAKFIFTEAKGVTFEGDFPQMTYADAMKYYGCDKPDIRFGMTIYELTTLMKGKDFKVIDDAQYVGAIVAPNCAAYTRKEIDELTEWVKRPQIGAKGLMYIKYNEDGTIKSSIDKFYSSQDLEQLCQECEAHAGDLLLIISGDQATTLNALCELRLELGNRLGFRPKDVFAPLWVVDFPLFEWDEESQRLYAKHHPFTSPKPEDIPLLDTNPQAVRANAYDFVVNGSEIGGGSIRIHNSELQAKMFSLLGFTPEQAQAQFGFLMGAFTYGAPPHGGLAFGFDRFVTILSGADSIRDVIAFPKNNAAKDLMAECPTEISQAQLEELCLQIRKK